MVARAELFDQPMACPRCETEIDAASGVCPACRWDSRAATVLPERGPSTERSYSERFYNISHASAASHSPRSRVALARGRLFLIVLTIVTGLLYATLWSLLQTTLL